jgi:cytochrome c
MKPSPPEQETVMRRIAIAGTALLALAFVTGYGMMGSGPMHAGMTGRGMMQSTDVPASADGRALFQAQCAACHTLSANGAGLPGPTLHGLFGRKAGSVPHFAYSAAMRKATVVWNRGSLDAFLTAPQTYVPGNAMPFAGIADTTARQRLIDYLEDASR